MSSVPSAASTASTSRPRTAIDWPISRSFIRSRIDHASSASRSTPAGGRRSGHPSLAGEVVGDRGGGVDQGEARRGQLVGQVAQERLTPPVVTGPEQPDADGPPVGQVAEDAAEIVLHPLADPPHHDGLGRAGSSQQPRPAAGLEHGNPLDAGADFAKPGVARSVERDADHPPAHGDEPLGHEERETALAGDEADGGEVRRRASADRTAADPGATTVRGRSANRLRRR